MPTHRRPHAGAVSVDSSTNLKSAWPEMRPTSHCQLIGEVRDWLILAWVLWWAWAYVQEALAERFPHWLGWTRTLW
jgi:hypothetical protein